MNQSAASTSDWIHALSLSAAMQHCGLQAWVIDLQPPAGVFAELDRLLAPDELNRAGRFALEAGRRRFIVSRAALRILLGQSTGQDPAGLRFTYSPKGKPFLGADSGTQKVSFNLAHSADLALIVVTSRRRVGVDIEWIPDRSEALDMALNFLALPEQEALSQVPVAERCRMFYRLWTRKEAVLKGSGDGITSGLHTPDLSGGLADATPEAGIAVDLRGVRWLVFDLAPGVGYFGAVAVEQLSEYSADSQTTAAT